MHELLQIMENLGLYDEDEGEEDMQDGKQGGDDESD